MDSAHSSKMQMNTPFRQPNDKTVLLGNQGQKMRPIPELKRINKCHIANAECRPFATELSPRTTNEPSTVSDEPAQSEVSVNNNPNTLHKVSPHKLQHSVDSILRDNRSAISSVSEINSLSPRNNYHPGSGALGDCRVSHSYNYYSLNSHLNINSTSIIAPPYRMPGHIGADPFTQRSEIGNRGQYTGIRRSHMQAISPTTSKQTLKRSNARYSRFSTSHYNSAMLYQKYNKYYCGNFRAESFSLTHNSTASNPSNQYNINDSRKYMSTHQKVRPGPKNTIQKDIPAHLSPPTNQFHQNYLQEAQAYGVAPHMHRLHYSGGSITSDHTHNIMPNTSRSIQNSSNALISSELSHNSQFSVDPRYSHVLTSPGSTRSHTIGSNNINQEHHLQGVTKRPVIQKRSVSTMQSPYSIYGVDLSQPKPLAQNQVTAHIDLTDNRNILNDNINALHISSSHPHSTPSNEYTLKVLNPAEINLGQNRRSQQINSNRTESIVIYKNDLGIEISASQNHLTAANQESQIETEKNIPAAFTNTSVHMSSPKKTQVEATNYKVKIASSSSPHLSASEHMTPIEGNNVGVKCQELVNPSTDVRAEKSTPAASNASANMSPSNPQVDNQKNLSSSRHSPLERMSMSPIKGNVDVNCQEPVLPSTQKCATEQKSSSSKLQIEIFKKENSNTLEKQSDNDQITSGNSPQPAIQSLAQETITEEEFMDGLNSLINQLRSAVSVTPVLLNRLCSIYARSLGNQQPMRRNFHDNNYLETRDDTVSSTTSRDVPAEV